MGEKVSQAEAARRLGVTKQRMHDLTSEGRIPLDGEGQVDMDTAEGYFAKMDPEARAKGGKEPQTPLAKERSDSQEILFKAKAKDHVIRANEREFDFHVKRGKYVLAEDVQAEMRALGKRLTIAFEQLPQRLAPRLVGLTVEAVQAEIEKNLARLAKEIRGDLGNELDAEQAENG